MARVSITSKIRNAPTIISFDHLQISSNKTESPSRQTTKCALSISSTAFSHSTPQQYSNMGDTAHLKQTLSLTDNTAQAIQRSASLMMFFYDKSPPMAVSAWRATLDTCHINQLLPLLYVANEVLQISKRNRGTKFLEAFGPVLTEALRKVCQRGRNVQLTEKVRRTAKIWGDRSVYSSRFVGDVLRGLEEYRTVAPVEEDVEEATPEENRFSPLTVPKVRNQEAQANHPTEPLEQEIITVDGDSDASMGSMDDTSSSPFQTKSSLSFTNLRVDKSAVEKSSSNFGLKRRLSDQGRKSLKKKKTSPAPTKPKTTISSSGFVELISQLSHADSNFKVVKASYNAIRNSPHVSSSSEEDSMMEQVGDELLSVHKQVLDLMESLTKKRGDLHDLAIKKHNIEEEMERYLKWMLGLVTVDEDEYNMCLELESQLESIQDLHGV